MKSTRGIAVLAACAALAAPFEARTQGYPAQRSLSDAQQELRRLRQSQKNLQADPSGVSPELSGARAVKKRMEALMERIAPALEGLVELQSRYAHAPDLAPLAGERESLRREIESLHDEYGNLWRPFNDLRQQEQLAQLQQVLAGGGKTDLNAKIAKAMELEEFYRAAKIFNDRTGRVMTDDAAAWEAAQQRIEKRRKLRLALLGAAGGLGLSAFLGTALYRRRRRAVTLYPAISEPVTPPSGAPGAAAMLPLSGAAQPMLSAPAQSLLGGPASGPAAGPAVLGGNYRVERELGRGGMGVVLEALDLTLQRKVALKRMRAEVSQEPKELERFLAEARLVAALKHPNIVEIHTMLREGSELYLVFELVPGKSLGERLAGGESLPPDAARALLRQIASALDYAHGEGVIHRDLKPANIMMTPKGVAKVMDFGLAHRTKMTVARVSRMDSFGTMPYMAPEQELGEYSKESDVFALGVCAYEMLAGKLPFEGPNFLAQKRERHFAPLSKAAPGIPKSWDEAIARALAPHPKDRFHSALELADALDAG